MGQDVAAWLGGVGGWASVAIVRATDTQWPPTHNGLTMASVAIVRATDTETIVRATQGTPARGPISKFPWIERAGLWGGRVGAVVGVGCGRCGVGCGVDGADSEARPDVKRRYGLRPHPKVRLPRG